MVNLILINVSKHKKIQQISLIIRKLSKKGNSFKKQSELMIPLLPSRAYITSEINRLLSILTISSHNMIETCFEMLKY